MTAQVFDTAHARYLGAQRPGVPAAIAATGAGIIGIHPQRLVTYKVVQRCGR